MFGYVRPVLSKLEKADRELYQSAYCGLCHAMGKRHGWLSRFTLNYDFTLLAMLHYGNSQCEEVICRRCPYHPIRKPRICLCGSALDDAADESLILMWHKLDDDVQDHNRITGIPARIFRRLFRTSYQKAAKAKPRFDERVRQELQKLRTLERENSPKLDRVADTFAMILAAASEDAMDCGRDQRALFQLLYHMGRWIYLADAWDDLGNDRKYQRYNPLDARFEGRAQDEREYVETTMTHSVRLAQSAFQLLDFGVCTPVVENILYLGMPTVQKAVLDGRWKEIKKQRRNIDERSL